MDTWKYKLRKYVMPAMHKLFTDDHDDHEDWTYGRQTFRMKDRDQDFKIFCVINWNLPSPNAGAAAYALQLQEGVSKDLVQDILEWQQCNYAKRFRREEMK